jgi:hypothetical protein
MSYKRVAVALRSERVTHVVDSNSSIKPMLIDEVNNR